MTTIGDNVQVVVLAQPQAEQQDGIRPEFDLRKQLAKKPKLVTDQGQVDSDESKPIGTPALYVMLPMEAKGQDDLSLVAVESHYQEEGCNPTTVENPMEVLGTIYIGKELGRGGYGIVYQAEMQSKKSGDPQLCIKMSYNKREFDDAEKRARYQEKLNESLFREAANFLRMSKDPNKCDRVVSMRSYFMSKDHNELFLGLEHCKGATLSKLIGLLKKHRHRRMPYKVLLKIMVDATEAVEFLMSNDLVHCDIKPSNFLYHRVDTPLKLIDFGCAIRKDVVEDLQGHAAGTPEYIAPELLLHKKMGVEKNSDIYGLGALFFHLVTFCRPWSHCIEVEELRGRDRSKLWEILREKFEAHTFLEQPTEMNEGELQEKYTELQTKVTDKECPHYKDQSLPCDLIKEMLTVDPGRRPTTRQIIDNIKTRCNDDVLRQTQKQSFVGKFDDVSDKYIFDGPSTLLLHDSDKPSSTPIPTDVRSMHNTSTHPQPKRRADQPSGSDQPPPRSVRRTGSSAKPVQPSDADVALPATIHAVPPESQSPVDAQRAEVPVEHYGRGDENHASPILDRSVNPFRPPSLLAAHPEDGNEAHMFLNHEKITSSFAPGMSDDDLEMELPDAVMNDLEQGTENIAIDVEGGSCEYSDSQPSFNSRQSASERKCEGSAAAVNVVEGGLPAHPDEDN